MTGDPILPNVLSTTMAFHHDSPWFAGHFPDHPILPGIAQLSVVWDLIRRSTEEKLCVKEFKRVKFKQIIHPQDQLEIQAVPSRAEPDTYSFTIKANGETACQGVITVGSKSTLFTEGKNNEHRNNHQ